MIGGVAARAIRVGIGAAAMASGRVGLGLDAHVDRVEALGLEGPHQVLPLSRQEVSRLRIGDGDPGERLVV